MRTPAEPVQPPTSPCPDTSTDVGPRLLWWRELATIAAFYLVYTVVRNEFGSSDIPAGVAYEHAKTVIRIERSLGIFFEQRLQNLFVEPVYEGERLVSLRFAFPGAKPILWIADVIYGSLHFIVTPWVLVLLWRRAPGSYRKWRNVLASTTALALVGFALFPLMPPRLLAACDSPHGACDTSYEFVDTMKHVGGLWSFDSETMQRISNQYAAMPSLHFAWAAWCWLAARRLLRRRARRLMAAYPWVTLVVIVVTANHYWLDAVGGAVTLAVSFPLAGLFTRITTGRRCRTRSHRDLRGGASRGEGVIAGRGPAADPRDVVADPRWD
ncbi:MAG: inositol phosphorylceramide synthase [Acidimicrobiales bacterium]|nr:MAG: inositol phosphorylceramide synthase [Acidimicrobiales bacterium]